MGKKLFLASGLAVAVMLANLLPRVAAAADTQTVHCKFSGLPCRTDSSWTRITWESADGTSGEYDFASLVFAFNWMLGQESTVPLSGLLELTVLDHVAASSGTERWLILPVARLEQLEYDGRWHVVPADGTAPEDGPWFVLAEDGPAGAYHPYIQAAETLEAAGGLALAGHGPIYHWQTLLDLVIADTFSLAAEIGGPAPAPPPHGSYPLILPGSEDELN